LHALDPPPAPDRPYIGVIGAGEASPPQLAAAEAVGRELARRGAILVCGGCAGVMEAACAGAQAEGGLSVGLLPGADRRAANPYVDVAIPTGLGELRNGLIVRASDALIAIGGEWGTLSEIALALKTGRSVVALDSWDLDRPGGPPGPERARDAKSAVDRALALAARR
jgi:uncharacterized protein (TIGR00725 family)